MMTITEAKLDMEKTITELTSVGTDLDPENPIIKDMKARRDKLKIAVDELERQRVVYETTLKAVEKEISSAEGVINNSVQREFSYGNRGG